MKLKKLTAVLMSAVILFVATSWSMVAGAIVLTETQYTYDSPNMSWLKDLLIKEDMNSIDGMTQRNTLVAKAEYPYTATAESFKEEVSYYQALSIVENRDLAPEMRYNSLYDMVVDEDLQKEDILRVAPYFSFK